MDALCGFDDEPDVSITQHDESRPATIQDEERGQFNLRLEKFILYKQSLDIDQIPVEKQILEKVENFFNENPISANFIRKEKGKLPYSVFKPHS
jgi:DNA replication initiation complex subunit (GINS family)